MDHAAARQEPRATEHRAEPNIFELGWAADSQEPFGEWAAQNVHPKDSPLGPDFLIDETPWLKEPAETIEDPTVQETVVNSAAQCGKSLFLFACLLYALCRRPGPAMFVAQTIDAVKDRVKGHLLPMIEACLELAAQLPSGHRRHNRSTRQILFPNATLLMGPANENFLRSHTIQWIFGDECSEWAPGRMEQARARTTRVWNRKLFFASTPLEAKSDFEMAYLDGTQERYHLATPCCGTLVYLTSENIEKLFTWEKPEEPTKGGTPNGEGIDWNALKLSVRLVCPGCGKKHQQSKADAEGKILHDEVMYRKMIAGARYVAANPKADREKRSFAFNVLCLPPSVFSWGKIVELYLKAKAEEVRGNLAPLKEFITLRLAETWDERKFLSFTLPNFENYDPNGAFPNEKFRALTVDCQEHLAEFHCLARSWDKDGASRLLEAATVHTEAEIKQLQQKWGIKDHLVGMDAAYLRYRVFDLCLRNGWTAMCGSDATEWLHELSEDGRKVRRPFSPVTRGDPRNGKVVNGKSWCVLFNWSNPTIKDLLWPLKEGRGVPWSVCDLGPEMSEKYAKWLDSERKREEIDRWGRIVMRWKKIRDNHFWDCECMQLVFAVMAKLFVFSSDEPKAPAVAAAA